MARIVGNVSAIRRRRPLGLQEVVGDRRQDYVVVPAGERAAFEVVEAEFGLQLLVLLLDRPPVMGDAHDHLERGGHRQVHQVVLGARRGPEVALAEQPDLGGQPALPPVVGGGDP